MIEFKRFCLYALTLFLSSALMPLSSAFCQEKEKESRKPPQESESHENGTRQDYNLMQNLLIQLESESHSLRAKELQSATTPKKSPKTEDELWLEDQIGTKQAAIKKTRLRSRISPADAQNQHPAPNPNELDQTIQPIVKPIKKIRMRSR